jgi:hypothetical protein
MFGFLFFSFPCGDHSDLDQDPLMYWNKGQIGNQDERKWSKAYRDGLSVVLGPGEDRQRDGPARPSSRQRGDPTSRTQYSSIMQNL